MRLTRLRLALAGVAIGAGLPGLAWAGVDVRLRGTLPPVVETNIRAHLSIVSDANAPDLTEAEVERLHARADKEIRAALQPLGYYNPQLRLNLSGEPPNWVAVYDIAIGPRTALDEVKTEVTGPGKDDATILAAEQKLGIKAGDLLDHRNYEAAKSGWLSQAIGAGYLDAAYSTHQLRIDTAQNSAAAWLTMATGIRYYFGPVTMEGEEPLAEDFLRRYVRFHEGEPFDPAKVDATRFAFTDLDQFDSVDVVADKADGLDDDDANRTPDGRIPVQYRFVLKPSRRYSAGVGYGTDTGARVSGTYEWRRLNPYGHRALINARISQVRSDVIGEYRVPIGTKPEERVAYTGRLATDELNNQRVTLESIGASATRVPGLWRRLYYTDYELEHNDTTAPRDSRVWIFGAQVNRGVFDDATFTRLGFSFQADVHGAPKQLFGTTSFLQERVVVKGALPLLERMRLLGRAELGFTQIKDFDTLPTLQRFYAGGDQSVRGYGYRSIGRIDPQTGLNIGGAYLAVYSAEVEYLLKNNIGGAVFADAGGADNKANPHLSLGAGVGLRYRAPFGVFRVDLAHPFDHTYSSVPVRFHLGVSIGL